MAPPSDREEPLLGCSLEEFVAGPSIPPLQRFTDELAEFCGACRAAAAGAVAAAGLSGAASALRRQAARDADMLLLAEPLLLAGWQDPDAVSVPVMFPL